MSRLALVMSGGGARAAYQVGFLAFLAEHYPELVIPVLTGVSAGAINAAHLANHPGSWRDRVEALAALWRSLKIEQVFRVDVRFTAINVLRWGLRLIMGRASRKMDTRGLLSTAPLQALLTRALRHEDGVLGGVARNIDSGKLEALAITASNYDTGQSVTWVQGSDFEPWQRTHRIAAASEIGVEHILASASLPFLFPAVEVQGQWYGDGGMRLTAPLSPAVHLGASHILAISTRYGQSADRAAQVRSPYPPPAQIAGAMYNAVFLDAFDGDALRLERINGLLDAVPVNARQGLRHIDLLLLRPSRDLGVLANDFEARLPKTFRFMERGFGTRETPSNDMLSLVMFQPDYLSALIELGYADARDRHADIEAFMETVAQ